MKDPGNSKSCFLEGTERVIKVIKVYTSLQLQYKSGKMKSWHSQTVLFFPAIHLFFAFPILYLSIEIDQNRSKSIKVDQNQS